MPGPNTTANRNPQFAIRHQSPVNQPPVDSAPSIRTLNTELFDKAKKALSEQIKSETNEEMRKEAIKAQERLNELTQQGGQPDPFGMLLKMLEILTPIFREKFWGQGGIFFGCRPPVDFAIDKIKESLRKGDLKTTADDLKDLGNINENGEIEVESEVSKSLPGGKIVSARGVMFELNDSTKSEVTKVLTEFVQTHAQSYPRERWSVQTQGDKTIIKQFGVPAKGDAFAKLMGRDRKNYKAFIEGKLAPTPPSPSPRP